MAENSQDSIVLGFTQVRTVRTISAVIAFTGMLLLFIQRVLAAVLVMAQEALGLAFARYNNFTGRFAAQNFAEDKKLLGLLKEVQGIVPTAEIAVNILLVVSVVLLLTAVVGLAFPKQFSHVLVAAKLLKWETGEGGDTSGNAVSEAISRFGNLPIKKLAMPLAILIVVFAGVSVVVSCHEKSKAASYEAAVAEMQVKAADYITAQRSYFASKQKIGGPKALQIPDSLASEYFTYKVFGTRFLATSVKDMGGCKAGAKWAVSASTKGVFTQELTLARITPKDSSCIKLTPEFKTLGRKKNP